MKKLLAVVLVLALPCAAGAFFFSPGGSSGGSGTTNASDLSSGTIPAARIGDNSVVGSTKLFRTGGTPSATTYFRGDNTWATPSGSGTVTGPATASEDNVVTWGGDNVTIKDSGVAISTLAPKASPTFTGTVTIPTPFTLGAVSVTPTGTELNFVDGVTSAIQDQLDAKAPLVSPSFTTPTLGVATATTLNTGQGAAELYSMNQNVRTTDNVTFANITFDMAVSTCVPADNNCGQTATNVGSPAGANLSAGLQWFDNTTQCFMIRNNDNTANITMSCLTKTFGFGIDNVATSDDSIFPRVNIPRAMTILSVSCFASTDNVVGNLSECTAADISSCTAIDSTDWTVGGATLQTVYSTFNSGFENASIAVGASLKWTTTSVGTTNSNKLSCEVRYSE